MNPNLLVYGTLAAATVKPNNSANSIGELVANSLTKFVIPVAAALAVGFVIYGGTLYVMSQGDPDKTSKAKKTILWAVVSVIIIVLTVPIINGIIDVVNNKILK